MGFFFFPLFALEEGSYTDVSNEFMIAFFFCVGWL